MLFEDIMNTCISGLQRGLQKFGEVLTTVVEMENKHDSYAVAVVAHELGTVGRVPRKISRLCHSWSLSRF